MIEFTIRTFSTLRRLLRAGKQVDADQAAAKGVATKKRRGPTLLRRIAENPIMNITAGFLLMATAMLEVLEPVWGTDSGIKSEHGAAIFGFLQFMKWLPDGFKGLKFVEEGDDDAPARVPAM